MITYKSSDDVLTIFLSGRIDSNNVDTVKSEITAIRDENPFGSIVMDATELEYISSAGLRVIMQLKKHEADLSIINVSPEVYDIFDVTGFTQMISIKKALRELSLEGFPVIAQGGHGTIYRLDDETIVKLFNENVDLAKIEDERMRAQKAMLLGVPTAIAFDVIKSGNCYGLVFEMINAKTMSAAIMDNPDQLELYVDKYIELLNQLHECSDDYDEYETIKSVYHSMLDNMTEYLEPVEVEKYRDIINAIPDGDTLVHGDFHPGNIMIQKDELVVIDMADISKGSPICDIIGLCRDTFIFANSMPSGFEAAIGMSAEMGIAFWNIFANKYYGDKSDAERALLMKLLSLAALISTGLSIGNGSSRSQELADGIVNRIIRGKLLPNADALISMLEKQAY